MAKNESLKPIYTTPSPNDKIGIFEGEIKLEQNSKTISVPASIKLNWLPSIRMRFETDDILKYGMPDVLDTGNAKLTTAKVPLSCDAFVTQVSHKYERQGPSTGMRAQVIIRGQLMGKPTISYSSTCDEVLFHLPNFLTFAGGELYLKNDEWDVFIRSNDNASDLIKDLEEQGGFALTHTGMIKRIEGGQIENKQALDMLYALHDFLSFVRGLWCGPILSTGYASSKQSWQMLNIPWLTPYKHVSSWFFDFEPHEINDAFNGFMKKWIDPNWNEPTRLAIYWYVEANIGIGGVEGSIVLIQAALELLAWACVFG